MQNSLLESNRASGQGGAFNAVSSDGVFFANVTFRDNSGLRMPQFPLAFAQPDGTAADFCRGVCDVLFWLCSAGVEGSGFCSTSLRMVDSLWLSNTAQYGGALYAAQGCNLAVHNTTFASNYAQVRRAPPAGMTRRWSSCALCAPTHGEQLPFPCANSCCSGCQQANGGAVVIGDGVNATFNSCTFLGNGAPPCAEVHSTLV